jgi:tellurite resistance protein
MDGKTLERLDAFIQVAVLGAYADGELAEEERRVLRDCIRRHADDFEQAQVMIEFAERLPAQQPPMNSEWRAVRIRQVKNVLDSRADRRSAFALAVRVSSAHQGVGVRESRLLLQLMHELEIEGEEAISLLEKATRARRLQREARTEQPPPASSPPCDETLRSPLPH